MNWLETKIPPPVVMILLGLAAYFTARHWPQLSLTISLHSLLAAVLVGIGIALDILPALVFRRARTTVNPLTPAATSSLVTTGIYRYTRNPMYLGQALILAGWAVYLQHGLALLAPVLFVLYITRFQIMAEERVLAVRFAPAYQEFCKQTRRWL